jgi:CRISPR-associated protein Cas2
VIEVLVVITYDVSTTDATGRKRLRKVSKLCQDYGIRVQNSVFECVVDSTQLKQLKLKLLETMNDNKDSIRIYRLGDNYKSKVEHFGVKEAFDLEGPLIL